MAKAISLAKTVAHDPADLLRFVIVNSCAAALIAAGFIIPAV